MINFCIAQALNIFIEHRSTGFQGIMQARWKSCKEKEVAV